MNAFDHSRLRALLKRYPLTPNGFGSWRHPNYPTDEERADLLLATTEIETARAWLAGQRRIANLNKRRTSYGLKHVAERVMGRYISNGAFIAAALLDGWRVQRLPDSSPNAWLNISQKTLPTRDSV